MNFKKALAITIASAFGFTAIGALLGAAIGALFPNYYQSLFLIPPDLEVSTVRIGIWLGSIQGVQG